MDEEQKRGREDEHRRMENNGGSAKRNTCTVLKGGIAIPDGKEEEQQLG